MGVAVYLSFLLFNSLVFPSLFLKLNKQDTNTKGFGSLPLFVIDYCVVGFA